MTTAFATSRPLDLEVWDLDDNPDGMSRLDITLSPFPGPNHSPRLASLFEIEEIENDGTEQRLGSCTYRR